MRYGVDKFLGGRPCLLAVLVLLLLLLGGKTQAQEVSTPGQNTVIDEALCVSEQRMLDDLEQRRLAAEQIHVQIERLKKGTLPASISPLTLLDQEDAVAGSTASLPATLSCPSLSQAWEQKLSNLLWLQSEIVRLRRQIWDPLPEALRDELMALWQSRARLDNTWNHLKTTLSLSDDPRTKSISAYAEALYAPLLEARQRIVRLLVSDEEEVSTRRAEAIFALWRYSVEPSIDVAVPDEVTLQAAGSEIRSALRDFEAAKRIEVLQLRGVLNETRAAVWRMESPRYRDVALQKAGSEWELMRLEALSVFLRLDRVLSEFTSDYQLDSSTDTWITRLTRGTLKTGLGLLLAWLLIKCAQASRRLAVYWHSRWSEQSTTRRGGFQLMRMTGGLPMLLPWVVGWIGLNLLQWLYREQSIVLLVPLVPFARLYILFGVLTLIGEWLVTRVVSQAGSFLTAEQSAAVDRRAAIAAAVIMLPWLVADLIDIAIGPSLLEQRVVALRELVIFFSAGLLLSLCRRDLTAAVQSITPARLDPWIERFLHRYVFLITAPLSILVLLPFFAASVVNRLLLDFDWYRTLYARGFRLKTGETEDGEQAPESAGVLLARYREWFDIDSRHDLPIVNTGLEEAVLSRMQPWLGDKSEENTLLLTGERGIGKSSALVRVGRRLEKEHPTIRLARLAVTGKIIDPPALWHMLGNQLGVDISSGPRSLVNADSDLQPTVLIIEDAHNLFLRTVNGFEAWKALMALTNTRLTNVFWLIAINNQSFAYLDNVFRHEFPLRNVLRAKQWSQTDIRSLILSRHSKSGIPLRYDEVLLASRGPEAGNVRNAEQRYFSLLWDASRGNAMMALRLWQTSLRADADTIVASLPALPRSSELESMQGPFLFVFASMLIHENMTPQELAATTALSESLVRAALKTGVDGGFITRDDQRRYRIATIWYPTLRNLLTRKNMLHE